MEAKERRASMASSDNNGYSVFTLTEKELKLFFEKFTFKLKSLESSVNSS